MLQYSFNKYVGLRIKVARVQKGLTQSELAACLDISCQQIQKYETGQNRVNCSRLYQIGKVLEQPTVFFFDGFEKTNGENSISDQADYHDLLAAPDAITLLSAFSKISSGKVRNSILALAQEYAENVRA